MSRYSDILLSPAAVAASPPGAAYPALPAINWSAIEQPAPLPVKVDYSGPDAPLPTADVAVLTWTSAEWSALDHVFLNSQSPGARSSFDLESDWLLYSLEAENLATDHPFAPLWGYYRLADIASATETLRVLLFKCDAHLAHPPWLAGLEQMVGRIADESSASWIYSIGTAGGATVADRLGDVVIANAAAIKLTAPDNVGAPINNQSFACESFPNNDVIEKSQQLLFCLDSVVTEAALTNLVQQLHTQVPESAQFELNDLLNEPLEPANLGTPAPRPKPGVPLLSTDYYFIATGDDAAQWSALEMDDAVIAYVVGERGKKYAFVRNISDPIVPALTPDRRPIPDVVRNRWAGLIYEQWGLFSSFNGAIVTWAAIAGGV